MNTESITANSTNYFKILVANLKKDTALFQSPMKNFRSSIFINNFQFSWMSNELGYLNEVTTQGSQLVPVSFTNYYLYFSPF